MSTTPVPPSLVTANLGGELAKVARHLRAMRLHRRGIRRWIVVTVLCFALLELRVSSVEFAPYVFPAMALLLVVAIARSVVVARRDRLDFKEAARVVEAKFPELKLALRTAAEQEPGPDGQFTYLQLRVIGSALQHANLNDWREHPQKRARYLFTGHAAALSVALLLALVPVLLLLAHKEIPLPKLSLPKTSVTVTPGDAEVERGAAVVIAARFDGRLPRNAELVWRQADGKIVRAPMARSLSDPVFAFTLPVVSNNTTYSVSHDGAATPDFTLKVFDQPALVRADATLNYPAYTGLAKKVIEDTRRVSAVTGTKLQYDFTMNKPMRDVTLKDESGTVVPLTATNPERTHFSVNLTIEHSERLALNLTDNDGRPNPAPADIRIEALDNKSPIVKMDFPQGDQRVSPIEEIHLQADVRNQFGLLDYGVAYSIGAKDPEFLSLHTAGNTTAVQANFSHVLELEKRGVEVGDLVTWFAWADDYGPDGKVRRTMSDPYFAEVRPFEMIFHEDDNAGAQMEQQQQQQQQQQRDPAGNLLETERQLSLAIWKLKQEPAPNKDFATDIATLNESQTQAIERLGTMQEQLQTPQQQAAAAEAASFMKQTADNLAAAGEKNVLVPLTPAWSGAQGAYQALLRLQSREFRVAQTRGQGRGGQQGNQRLQSQLSQLRFNQQQNRYQTENTAQSPTTPQQRQQLQAESRLRELARRQQDLNQRLQELQTALAAAQDQQKRDEIQRELKRLEEEQRNMLADLDAARQQIDQLPPGEQAQQARQQLDQAREDMRRSGDQLAQNQVSQALASGTRAGQSLQQTEESLRRDSSSRFSDQMSSARQQARDLASRQAEAGRQLQELAKGASQSLDDSEKRQALAQAYAEQRDNLNKLMENLRQVTEDSETTEPGLHKQLYDLLRQQGQANTATDLKNGAELLRNGFITQTQPLQTTAAQNLDQLRRGVERAADSVLGDDSTTMRFAQNELNDLERQLLRDQPANSDQFRGDSAQPGENGQPAEANGNETPNRQPSNRGGRGQGQDQLAQNNSSNSSPQGQSGAGQRGQQSSQPDTGGPQGGAQPGQGGQGGGQQPGDEQVAQQDANGQPSADGQPGGNRQGGGRQGGRQGGNRQGGGQRGGNGGNVANNGGGANNNGGQWIDQLGVGGGGDRVIDPANLPGPITGADYAAWADRLRTVENLVDDPQLRQTIANARAQADDLRRNFQRHSQLPQWDVVASNVLSPLDKVRAQLRQELARREQPDSLQPVDQDPVPDKYADSVKRYYEALGN